MLLTVTAAGVLPNLARRQLAGTLFRYGEIGHTDAGPLRIEDPSALEIPADLTSIPLTLEHDPNTVRGHLAILDDNGERVYIAVAAADGQAGDDALAEAADRSRGGFSYVIADAEILDGVLIRGRLVAIGQVAEPAYNSARIDQIAAARSPQTPGASRTTEGDRMTPEQIARLAELRALETRTDEQTTELAELLGLAADQVAAPAEEPAASEAPTSVAASLPTSLPRPAARTAPAGGGSALQRMYSDLSAALQPGRRNLSSISAALADVTNTEHPAIEAPAWSGELWSGLQYSPKWSNLFTTGALTSWSGSGWRWVTKPSMQDYTGDKAAVPSNELATEPGEYEAARMAVGHDIDRKFYDFPNQAFLASYAEAAREDWARKLDAKVRAYVIAQATAYPTVDPDADTLLKAAALAAFGVEDNTGAKATFLAVNRADFLTLLDVTNDAAPAFLDMFGIKPENFVVDSGLTAGTVIAGVRQAATVRTLPGSPIRADAQHIANGGVDSAFFGYWAIEEHHTTGIVKATFA